jgi:hypothetical protein
MPTAPIIIPLIVAGLMLGSLLISQPAKISKKKLLGVAVIAGLLNMANAYVVYTLFPPAVTRFGGGGFTAGGFAGGNAGTFQFRGASAESSFMMLSFITGLVIVLGVVGIALAYARYKGRQPEEEAEETKSEEI